MMEYAKGLIQLGFMPNKDFVCRDDGNGAFIEAWLSANPQPTTEEIMVGIAQYEANEYQRQRASAYPSIADQLDKIYHEGIDAWKAQIAAVKEQYPKGTV